jgi:hypothetical protein
MTIVRAIFGVIMATVAFHCAPAQSQQLSYADQLIERYADIQVNVPAGEREKPMILLLQDAVSYRALHPDDAAAWITTGRIRAGHAAAQDVTRMLGLMKQVKTDMETAISLDPAAQEGRAQAFLGMLYTVLPGWPLSFGDDKKGALLMDAALRINATNSPNCYYYARYLIAKKQYQKAREYLLRARTAVNADAAHPRWQKFQQKNIEGSLQAISGKL